MQILQINVDEYSVKNRSRFRWIRPSNTNGNRWQKRSARGPRQKRNSRFYQSEFFETAVRDFLTGDAPRKGDAALRKHRRFRGWLLGGVSRPGAYRFDAPNENRFGTPLIIERFRMFQIWIRFFIIILGKILYRIKNTINPTKRNKMPYRLRTSSLVERRTKSVSFEVDLWCSELMKGNSDKKEKNSHSSDWKTSSK